VEHEPGHPQLAGLEHEDAPLAPQDVEDLGLGAGADRELGCPLDEGPEVEGDRRADVALEVAVCLGEVDRGRDDAAALADLPGGGGRRVEGVAEPLFEGEPADGVRDEELASLAARVRERPRGERALLGRREAGQRDRHRSLSISELERPPRFARDSARRRSAASWRRTSAIAARCSAAAPLALRIRRSR
jgi:hypothetical protein